MAVLIYSGNGSTKRTSSWRDGFVINHLHNGGIADDMVGRWTTGISTPSVKSNSICNAVELETVGCAIQITWDDDYTRLIFEKHQVQVDHATSILVWQTVSLNMCNTLFQLQGYPLYSATVNNASFYVVLPRQRWHNLCTRVRLRKSYDLVASSE